MSALNRALYKIFNSPNGLDHLFFKFKLKDFDVI